MVQSFVSAVALGKLVLDVARSKPRLHPGARESLLLDRFTHGNTQF